MMMNKKILISIVGLIELIFVYFAFCVSTVSYKGDLFVYLTIVLFGIVSLIYFLLFRKLSLCMELQNSFKQIHIVNLLSGILIFVLLLRDMQGIHFLDYQKILLIMFLITNIGCESIWIKKNGLIVLKKQIRILEMKVKDDAGVFAILIIFGGLSIYLGGTPYKWDSHLYYNTCQELNAFSVSDLAIYGHIAQTFGLLIKLGTTIIGNVTIAAQAVNVFVAMCGIVSFYGILKQVGPKFQKIDLLLATGVYAFSSYVLGLVNYFNLDYYCACLFPVILYFMITEKRVFHILTALLFCFTKEPAIIIYAGLCLAYLLGKEVQTFKENGLKDIKKIFVTVQYWYMALVGILWYMTYCLLGPWSAGEGATTFNIAFAWEKIKVMYLMNFSWYFSVLCMLAIIIAVVAKKQYGLIYVYFLIPLLAFTIFSCVFQTANHYRYNAIVMFTLCSISMIYVLDMQKKNIRRMVLVISCIISLCSSYLSIDPISNYLFETVYTGNGYVWTTSDEVRLADSAIYNKQMLWAEDVLNLAFREAIQNEDLIMLQVQNDNLWYADGLTEFSQLSDEGYTYSFFWNSNLEQRVNLGSVETQKIIMAQVKGIEGIEHVIESNNFAKTYYYISISGTNDEVFQEIKNIYSVIEESVYQYANWKYRCIRFQ